MYAGFNLKLDKSEMEGDLLFQYFLSQGEKIYTENQKQVRSGFEEFISPVDGSIDGSALQNEWFPQIEANIFLSHSHADKDLALALAGWLDHYFSLKVFIDSTVWGYAGDLLKGIDKAYCYSETSKTYDYDKRNYSTSHVHMMLSAALHGMIDKTEGLILLNTPTSIKPSDEVHNQTKSPWIYSELLFSKMVRRKAPKRSTVNFEKSILENSSARALDIGYKVDTSHLVDLNHTYLMIWQNSYQTVRNQGVHPLDTLYQDHDLVNITMYK